MKWYYSTDDLQVNHISLVFKRKLKLRFSSTVLLQNDAVIKQIVIIIIIIIIIVIIIIIFITFFIVHRRIS